jgi:hypothetical protein
VTVISMGGVHIIYHTKLLAHWKPPFSYQNLYKHILEKNPPQT